MAASLPEVGPGPTARPQHPAQEGQTAAHAQPRHEEHAHLRADGPAHDGGGARGHLLDAGVPPARMEGGLGGVLDVLLNGEVDLDVLAEVAADPLPPERDRQDQQAVGPVVAVEPAGLVRPGVLQDGGVEVVVVVDVENF